MQQAHAAAEVAAQRTGPMLQPMHPSIPLHAGSAAGLLALALALSSAPCAAAPDAQAFVAQWRQAVGQPGGEAVAELTAFPFLFENRPLDRRAFVAQAVPALFKPAARRCLQRAQPVAEDGRLVVTCPPYGYVFGPTPAGWRLIEFFVDTP